MENRLQEVLAAAMLAAASAASAQDLTEAQARAAIAPWYALFNQPVQSDAVKTVHEQLLAPDYQSCWGVLPGACWGRDQSMKVVGNFARSIADMNFASAFAASACFAPLWTPVENMVIRCRSPGSGPT